MFEKFNKIPRLKKDVVITEKIDGTNAQIHVFPYEYGMRDEWWFDKAYTTAEDMVMLVGSRNRYISPDDDNYGFATWAWERADKLIPFLGEGRHYGEWWGQGIQRRYDMDEKVFSLFNVKRWGPGKQELPDYLRAVPLLYQGSLLDFSVDEQMQKLKEEGSVAAPGFMDPEGLIVYHSGSNSYFKTTFEFDKGKWSE